ncbi:MAG: TetR-like C-terminal domain-containing protein [Pseudomonadota bacterium]
MAARFAAALEGCERGSVEAIVAIGLEYIAFAEAEPGVFRMMFAAQEGDGDDIRTQGLVCYGIVLDQVAAYLGCDEVTEDIQNATFPLWTFVHGLAFLRIDGKMDVDKVTDDLPTIVASATKRLLADRL